MEQAGEIINYEDNNYIPVGDCTLYAVWGEEQALEANDDNLDDSAPESNVIDSNTTSNDVNEESKDIVNDHSDEEKTNAHFETGEADEVSTIEEDLIQQSPSEEAIDTQASYANTLGLGVTYHSQEEIRKFIKNNPAPLIENSFAEEPSEDVPYKAGRLSKESLSYGLNALNQMRFVAGIDADVSLDDGYNVKAQASALVNAVNGELSHHPDKPAGMDDELYSLGYSGASSSNLAAGLVSLAGSVRLWMSDSDNTNIDRVGHRRWIIFPKMQKTGFGAVYGFSAVYALDHGREKISESRVAWPAQNMPLDFFHSYDAWSISFGKYVSATEVKVSIRRRNDGNAWEFSSTKADGYFNVDNQGYGQIGCVIFRPNNITYKSGDVFDVTITGAESTAVQYSVEFFSICDNKHDYYSKRISNPKCEEEGIIQKICKKCGEVYYEYENPLGHDYKQMSSKNGVITLQCKVCGKKQEGSYPTDFMIFWKKASDPGYYWNFFPDDLNAPVQVAYTIDSLDYSSYNVDYYFDDYVVNTNDTTNCVVDYSNQVISFKKAGIYKITIYPKYNPKSKSTYQLRVGPAISISSAVISGLSDKSYTGKSIAQTPTVKIGAATLEQDIDYEVSFRNNTNAGIATVTITGIGIYKGTKAATFKINKAAQKISAKAATTVIPIGGTTKITVSGAKETTKYVFTSSDSAIATVSSTGVVTGKKAGTVTITATSPATANYNAASKTVKITVKAALPKPGNCRFSKWNNAKYNSCQIEWNKVAGADGYQTILSWTDGSHASTKNLKSNVLKQDCSVAVNHVSQFKVRAFKNTAGGKIYSPWSNVAYITPSPTTLKYKNTGTSSNPKASISWNIIYGCNGYNVFLTTNPNGTWYWNQSTSTKASATSATITKYRGAKLKKGTRYYVRIVTRRKRNGVFCTVPLPAKNTSIGSFVVK